MPLGKFPESGYPPAVWSGLTNLRPLLDALPYDSFPLPQQNPQRTPFCEFARVCCTDGGHAGITDPYRKAVWLPITISQASKITISPIGAVYGGLLGAGNVPPEHRGNLIVCENSTARNQYTPWTDKASLAPAVEATIAAGWTDPVTPIINVVGMGDGLASSLEAGTKTIAVSPFAITVRGSSNYTAPWQVHLMNACGAMPKGLFDSLKASGKLCATLEKIAREVVPNLFTSLVWICGTAPPLALTFDQHVALASAMAKRANAYEAVPEISDFDRWFNQHGTGLDRESAKAGWDARGISVN